MEAKSTADKYCHLCKKPVDNTNHLVKCCICGYYVCPDCRWQIPDSEGRLTEKEICDNCSY